MSRKKNQSSTLYTSSTSFTSTTEFRKKKIFSLKHFLKELIVTGGMLLCVDSYSIMIMDFLNISFPDFFTLILVGYFSYKFSNIILRQDE